MTIIDMDKMGEALNTKADIDLNNTGVFSTSEGGVINLTSSTPANASGKEVTSADFFQSNLLNYTTNRILEIPQDIKLELNNGTLTLKAGSKVYVPNGVGVFDEIVVSADKTLGTVGSVTGQTFLLYDSSSNSLSLSNVATTLSGSSAPSNFSGVFYNSTNNIILVYSNGVSDNKKLSFPVAIYTRNSGVPTSIDQIFNGFGYIGSTVFALPGVKVQIPNGRNEDGTFKSFIKTTPRVSTWTWDGIDPVYNFIGVNGLVDGMGVETHFDAEKNLWLRPDGAICVIARHNHTPRVENFEPYTVDSVLNSNLSNLSAVGQVKFDAKLDYTYLGDGIIDIPSYFNVGYGGSGAPSIGANSKIPVPNGIDSNGNIIYDLQTITSSLSVSDSDVASIYQTYKFADIVWLWKPGETNLTWIFRETSCAGDTAPSTTANRPGWFDTSTGLMKVFNSTTNEWESGYSVPLFQTHGFKGKSDYGLKPSYYCYGFFMLGRSIVALPGIRYRTAYNDYGSDRGYRSKFKEYQTETLLYSKNSTGTASYNAEMFFLVSSNGTQKLKSVSRCYGSKTSTPNFWGGSLPDFYDARNDVWISGPGQTERRAIIGCLKVKQFSDGTVEQVLNVRIPSLEHPDKFRYIVEEGGNSEDSSESTKYRLWNDGWLETWGVQTKATSSADFNFPLRYHQEPAAFVSTQSSGTFATAVTSKNNISITVFKLTAGAAPTSGTAKFSWYACGLAYGYPTT